MIDFKLQSANGFQSQLGTLTFLRQDGELAAQGASLHLFGSIAEAIGPFVQKGFVDLLGVTRFLWFSGDFLFSRPVYQDSVEFELDFCKIFV